MDTWIIYRHVNTVNQKSYIGLTKQSLEKRWQNGLGYTKTQPLFYRAIQKYGWESFTHEILEENIISLSQANEREKYWIAYYHTWQGDTECWGYNLTPGGEGCPNHEVSKETRYKIGLANSGKIRSEAFKQNLRVKLKGAGNPFYGKVHSEETKALIRAKAIGRKTSEETKLKISNALKNRPVSEATRQKLSLALMGKNTGNIPWNKDKSIPRNIVEKANETKKLRKVGQKPVVCLETGQIFESLMEAARFAGISQSTLSNCLAGRAKTAGKYHWSFKN